MNVDSLKKTTDIDTCTYTVNTRDNTDKKRMEKNEKNTIEL